MRIERFLRAQLIVALLWAFSTAALAQGLLDDLAVAVANDRADEVKRLLARGMDPNSVDSSGDTMLCIGARNGSSRAETASSTALPKRAAERSPYRPLLRSRSKLLSP